MPKKTFKRLPEERQNELLERAGDCIMNMDYTKLRVEDLTKAMGIPVGSFYRYFEDRDDVAAAYFVYADRAYSEDPKLSAVFEPQEPDDELFAALEHRQRVFDQMSNGVYERVFLEENFDRIFQMYKQFLTELKYEGKLRADVDSELIAFMYATNLYNLQLYFKKFGIEDMKLRWRIKKYFYYTFFKYGIMGKPSETGEHKRERRDNYAD